VPRWSWRQARSWRIWRDLFNSCDLIWCDDLNSSFFFALSFFHSSAFSFFRLHFLKQLFANFRTLFLVVSCFTHSVSQSVCCALSLHCRPSAFCVIAQQQQKLLVSFCWTTAYDLSFSFILCSKSLLNSLSVRPSELRLAVVKDTTLPFLNFGCCCLRLMVLPFGHLIRTCSLENFCFLKRIILLRLIRIYSVVIIALFLQVRGHIEASRIRIGLVAQAPCAFRSTAPCASVQSTSIQSCSCIACLLTMRMSPSSCL